MLRVAAINTLAIIVFMEELIDRDTIEFLEYFEDIFNNRETESKILEAALNSYGLLYGKAAVRFEKDNFNVYLLEMI